ncbi:UNVERIFIED_ORG: hypothetical protein LHJ69_23530 [Shinella sp. XGS7]|nr:hypothetical protein [Shinella sp. XGS7]
MIANEFLKKLAALAVAFGLLLPPMAQAADSYQHGNIYDTTSIAQGLMIRIESGPPGNCAGTPQGWMLIKSEHKAMMALALLMLASGKRGVVVYTMGIGSSGFCEINQLDPIEV